MRKLKKTLLVALPLTLALAFTSFAGQWQEDPNGWWYQEDDGSYLRNGWYWLDGNQDGVAECYYFGNDGYLETGYGHGIVDGCQVDGNGAWMENGVVQTRPAN